MFEYVTPGQAADLCREAIADRAAAQLVGGLADHLRHLPTTPGTQLEWTYGPNRGPRAWLRHQLRHRPLMHRWAPMCGYCPRPVLAPETGYPDAG